MDGFLRLYSPKEARGLAEWAPGEVELEGVVCPIDPAHRRAGRRIGNLGVLLPGRAVQDVIWTWYSEALIQQRVLDVLVAEGITGFETKPARVRWKQPRTDAVPSFLELVVTGWGGVAPPDSGTALVESCPACGLLRYSCFADPTKLVDPAQWDGSDLFVVWPLPKFVFVTQRAAAVMRKHKLGGIRFVPPEKLACRGGLGPGRLSYWMPEARARELGKPLGIY